MSGISVVQQRSSVSKEQGDQNRITLKYWVDGTTSEDAATAAFVAAVPTILGVYQRTGIRVESTEIDTHWDCAVTYTAGSNQQQGADPVFSLEIATSTAHITQSMETVGAYSLRSGGATDNKGVIGGKSDGTVDGVDKLVAACSWTETHFLPPSRVNRNYFNLVALTAATMNADTFRTFDPGEVMLVGATMTKRQSADDFECQFKFLPLPNATGLIVGDITGINKIGHDYLWVRYK